MTSPQKAKGGAWERQCAKVLSELYEESFVRTAHSGAFIGGTNAHRKAVLTESQTKSYKGDITPPDSWNNLNIECKSYKDFPFHLVLTGNCKVLDGWLSQLMDVAEESDCNVLMMKFNRKGSYVVVPSKYTWVTDNFMYYTSGKHGDWIIVDFNDFFKYNKDLFKTYSS